MAKKSREVVQTKGRNPYTVSPPPPRLRHPLEENIFTSLLLTLLAILVAVILGVPLLIFTGILLIVALFLKYTLLTLHSLSTATAFFCANRIRNTPANRTPPPLFPKNKLAPGNDVRWIGTRARDAPQPIIQTLLLFEGTIQLQNLRTLLVSRVLGATENGELIYPQLTQKLRSRLGGYVWERDPEFAIQNHVFATPNNLQTEDQVKEYVGQLFRENLHPSRPPWEVRLLPPYGPSKDTLILARVHQALADGTTLLRILTQGLADRQGLLHHPQKSTFGAVGFSFNLLRSMIVGPLTVALWLFSTPRDRNRLTTPLTTTSSSSLNKKKEEVWKVGWSVGISLPEVSRIKQIMRSTYNDVLLSAAAGGIRKYLQISGTSYPSNLKALVPVDLRSSSPGRRNEKKKLGWKAASILTSLPTGIEGAIPRLWAARQRLDEVKASADPVVAYFTTSIFMNIFPQPVGAAILDSITNKASVQVANMAGPTTILTIGGYILKGLYPFFPPPGEIRVAITFFSYADQIHVTALSHPSLLNAPVQILKEINLQIGQLSRQLSQRKVPGESRRANRYANNPNADIQKPPTQQIHVKLQVVQQEIQELAARVEEGDDEPPAVRNRLDSLKTEFTDLIGELRRRSSIIEGVCVSYEDEDAEDQFRKPRKRALSVVSVSRRNSLFPPPRNLLQSESTHSFQASTECPSSPLSLSHSPIRTTAV